VKEVVKDLIASLIVKEPLIGLLAKRTWIYSDESLEHVASTDGLRIYINPKLFSKLPDSVKLSVLAHEIMHIVLKHVTRAKYVRKMFPELNVYDINIVADAKANQYLLEAFTIPPYFITPKSLASAIRVPVDEVVNSSLEEICEMIAKLRRLPLITPQKHLELDVAHERDCRSCNYEILNEGDAEDEGISSGDEVEERVAKKYAEAFIVAKTMGRAPGWAERILNELLKPKVPWQRLLRTFLTKGMGKRVKRTWTRPSRKHPSFPGKELLKAEKIIVLVDTSGSIGEKELQRFLTEVYAIVKDVAEVVVVPWDAVVYEEQIIRRPSDIKRIKIKGGGGTVIRPALELATRKYPDSMIVILSDWHIADLNEPKTEELLRKHADSIVAVTTSATPPEFLRNVVKIEVR